MGNQEPYAIIPVTYKGQTHEVKVSLRDYEWLNQYNWRLDKRKHGFYVKRNRYENGRTTSIYMHREVTGASTEHFVDHKHGDTLDNRRSMLRVCSVKDNNRNTVGHQNAMSRYKGVTTDGTKFRARICVNEQQISIGTYATEKEAAHAYNERALLEFGEFARLNDLR